VGPTEGGGQRHLAALLIALLGAVAGEVLPVRRGVDAAPAVLSVGLRLCGDQPQQPGQTADHVLLQVDIERMGETLVNRRLAYVAVSRGRYDAQIYTNDKPHLAETLGREVSHRSAWRESPAEKIEPSMSLKQASQQIGLSRVSRRLRRLLYRLRARFS
jgi:hypothetical protein